jgi:type III pantothenate kinase
MDNSPRYLGFLKKKMNYFMEMDPGLQFPFRIAYQTPETLGKDRLAAIVGAYTKFPKQNVLVIDAGSAVTYDILTDQEEYVGGNISPGLEMRYKALHQFTGRLPLVTPEITGNTYGRTTREAINEGVLQGMLYEVEGYIARWQKIYEDLKIILTGGDANFFEKKLKNGIFVNLNLVTNGLNTILNINVQK